MAKHRIPDKATFRQIAEAMRVQLGDQRVIALPKQFSTGSYGWYHSGKITHDLSGEPVIVQVSLSMVVVGSKDAPSRPGMTAAERLAEQEAAMVHGVERFSSPLYPVRETSEKADMAENGPGMPQEALASPEVSPAVSAVPGDSGGNLGAKKRSRKSREGGK